MLLQKYKVFLNNTNLRIDISHKYLQPIYFKHAHISQLPDFVAIQQFHSSRAFVEVVAERDAAVQHWISPLRVHSLRSTGSGDWSIRLSVVI